MANEVDFTKIVDPNHLMPMTGPEADFIQSSTLEMVKAICMNLVANSDTFSPSIPYAIQGVDYAGNTTTPTSIDPGYIFYGFRLYRTIGISVPVTVGATFVLTTVSTALEFSDGVYENVLNENTAVVTDQTLGTGTFNLAQIVHVTRTFNTFLAPADYTTSGGTVEAITGGLFTTPATGVRNFKFTWTGDGTIGTSAALQGYSLTIVRVTGGAILVNQTASYTTSIGTVRAPFAVQINITGVLPGETFQLSVQRSGTNNVTIKNMRAVMEEYSL